ncbi:DUF5106 domain-containing protein [Sphingobacterium chungjuense]|uniref:DUF5106 domain-containing protein n=1 Tax=Sphingobacterium chungjuense TaxID=2675553 RepID=UPI001409D9E0|nr:DUF5106 domain-containing protein [Sphingobacterium chungjuense]
MKTHFVWCILLVMLVHFSCQEKRAEKPETMESATSTVTDFWEKFDFKDSLAIVKPEVGEQAVVDFITIAAQSDPKKSADAIKTMLKRASFSPKVLNFFAESYGKYLYDPNSPMYNETLYQAVLEFLVDEESIPDYHRQRFQDRLTLIQRNNPGSKATNFAFQTVDGKNEDLFSQQSKYILLFFYEPGCGGCAHAIESLQPIAKVQEWIKRGDLQILAVYANAEPNLWKDYQQYIPSLWKNVMNADRSIVANNLYDLKASPTFYLLDDKKVVLLKDRNLGENIGYLERFLH